MVTTMLRLIWALSVSARYFLRRYMPTNILLDLIRARQGLSGASEQSSSPARTCLLRASAPS
jgi:hypothetical protein